MQKILVMEDELITRKVVCSILKRAGYHTIEADNGYEGLEKARSCRPDLILSDIVMPVMNGIEALKRKNSDKHLAEIPVIFLSASVEFASEALENGARAFLEKSAMGNELLNIISESLNQFQKIPA